VCWEGKLWEVWKCASSVLGQTQSGCMGDVFGRHGTTAIRIACILPTTMHRPAVFIVDALSFLRSVDDMAIRRTYKSDKARTDLVTIRCAVTSPNKFDANLTYSMKTTSYLRITQQYIVLHYRLPTYPRYPEEVMLIDVLQTYSNR